MAVLANNPVEVVCCINCSGDNAHCDPQKNSQIVKDKIKTVV